MSIRIHTKAYQSGGTTALPDTYFDKVVKYIPADVVGAWVAATGIVQASAAAPKDTLLWIIFVAGVLITAAWKLKQTKLPIQAAVSTGAFAVWVFALGGPFQHLAWYRFTVRCC
jgi:hypothetical protein